LHSLSEPTDEQRHRQRAFYLANVTMTDKKIGEFLSTLDETGDAKNTIIILLPIMAIV
jgi:arylsulfatase